MAVFDWDNICFNYRDEGEGFPFFFQHGLGGDLHQPFTLFRPPAGFRLIGFDCRGHGLTEPLGSEDKIGIAAFADDLLALMNRLEIERAVIGGISMGSALALNFALRHADRVAGLVLSRPAWLEGPLKRNVEVYGQMVDLIRQHGAKRGLEIFKQTPIYQEALRKSPDTANSMVRQFENPRIEERLVILDKIPKDRPNHRLDDLKVINVPTLVLANRMDAIHPFEYGEALAAAIPGAEFKELTPKSLNKEQHGADVQNFIAAFLQKHFGKK
jgi:pimeloyl-ACP methyl ester carboxylesterase